MQLSICGQNIYYTTCRFLSKGSEEKKSTYSLNWRNIPATLKKRQFPDNEPTIPPCMKTNTVNIKSPHVILYSHHKGKNSADLSIRAVTHCSDYFSYFKPVDNLAAGNSPNTNFSIYRTTDEVIIISRTKLYTGHCMS